MGGEKPQALPIRQALKGSPPRGRGKDVKGNSWDKLPGITPAWAGKSHPATPTTSGGRDHPRVGGEKFYTGRGNCAVKGSPPRGRGKAVYLTHTGQGPGITPAWAGKSRTGFCGITLKRDHPRVGGEKQPSTSCDKHLQGSPPRGRGKEFASSAAFACAGITPAWAGKRAAIERVWKQWQDHPRVGGEKIASCTVCRVSMGSPPRGRGKVSAFLAGITTEGITPAWAGKSG